MKRKGVHTGLGDRIGNYLIYATIGDIKKCTIYTTWNEDSNNWRSNQYPNNIHEYIQFPSTLEFVTNEEYNNLEYPHLNYKGAFHAFDYIPETIFKTLSIDKIIDCNWNTFYNSYKKMCNQLKYLKNLPDGVNERFGMIHLRRDDKGNVFVHTKRILNIISKFKNKKWIITSDNIIHKTLFKKLNINIFEPNWSKSSKIKIIEQFFYYKHASIIVQSVPGSGPMAGWSAFSYVPFQLGIANYPKKNPMLISCNLTYENTRFTNAKKFLNKTLHNVIMFEQIMLLRI